MYRTPEEARASLDGVVSDVILDLVVKNLHPAFAILPDEGDGTTHMGGVPLLPSGIDWPMRPPETQPGIVADRGGSRHRESLLEALSRPRPLRFLMQVDLSRIGTGKTPVGLPAEGLLSFFYDAEIGPWDSGPASARVVWTPEPSSAVEGACPESESPRRAMRSEPMLFLPNLSSADLPEALAKAFSEDEESRDNYSDMLIDRRPRTKVLGQPDPEQDDPRYDAFVVDAFGKQHLSREEWKEHRDTIMAGARGWLQIAQVDMAQALPELFAEGTVHFLIKLADLAERRFEKVMAVYQQT